VCSTTNQPCKIDQVCCSMICIFPTGNPIGACK
jgi:hypothetical protein